MGRFSRIWGPKFPYFRKFHEFLSSSLALLYSSNMTSMFPTTITWLLFHLLYANPSSLRPVRVNPIQRRGSRGGEIDSFAPKLFERLWSGSKTGGLTDTCSAKGSVKGIVGCN